MTFVCVSDGIQSVSHLCVCVCVQNKIKQNYGMCREQYKI